jgi:hypothetical protein
MVVRWVPPFIDYCWLGIKQRLLSVRSPRERALYSQFTAERYPAGLQAGGQTHPTAMFAARGELISTTTILCLLDAPPHDATSVLNAQHAVCSQRPNIRIQK